jgi:hypothetical protein
VQQLHTELTLELAHLRTESGLGEMQAFGGAAEMQFLGDRNEVAQAT